MLVGGGAAGGRVDEALGRPTCGRGGVAVESLELTTEVVDDEGELDAAYGCSDGAIGVRGEKPPEEVEVSRVNIAVPMASISSELSAKSILGMSVESRPSSLE